MNKAQGLRRKARSLRHRAQAATREGRTWDAAQLTQRALNFEARADCEPTALTQRFLEDRAGFEDEDIPTISTVREAEDFYGLVLR